MTQDNTSPKRQMASAGPASIVVLGILGPLAVGLAFGAWVTRPAPPADLQDDAYLALAPALVRTYDDARMVTLHVTTEEPQAVPSPRDGRVSAITCTPGTPLASGDSLVSLDGTGVVSLATAVPGWRDLAIGDVGQDVGALNTELRRLGHGAPESHSVTPETVEAFRATAHAAGVPAPEGLVIPLDRILWLPGEQALIAQCPVRLGETVASGAPLFTLQSASSAHSSLLPADAIAGGRTLDLGIAHLPIADDGQVAREDLAELLSSDAYLSAVVDEQGSRQITVRWALSEPTKVWVVPPGAVVVEAQSSVCVVAPDDTTVPVNVVGSELGQTFVIPTTSTPIPPHVRAVASASTGCE